MEWCGPVLNCWFCETSKSKFSLPPTLPSTHSVSLGFVPAHTTGGSHCLIWTFSDLWICGRTARFLRFVNLWPARFQDCCLASVLLSTGASYKQFEENINHYQCHHNCSFYHNCHHWLENLVSQLWFDHRRHHHHRDWWQKFKGPFPIWVTLARKSENFFFAANWSGLWCWYQVTVILLRRLPVRYFWTFLFHRYLSKNNKQRSRKRNGCCLLDWDIVRHAITFFLHFSTFSASYLASSPQARANH